MAKDAAPPSGSPSAEGSDPRPTPQPPRREATRRQVTRRRVNGRFLLILLGVVAALGAGTHFVHLAMVSRNADSVRERAVAAEEAGDNEKAIQLYSQYRKLHPEDVDATIALAELLRGESDSAATWKRVYDLLEGVLREDPARDEVRRPLVDAALKLQQYPDADAHLDYLISLQDEQGADPELFELKAEVQEGLRRYAEAGAFYIKAIQIDPSKIEPYAALARVLTENPDAIRPLMSKSKGATVVDSAALSDVIPKIPPGARSNDVGPAIVDAMVKNGKPAWQALVKRARYHQSTAKMAEAVADARTALKSPEASQSADAVLAAAQIELAAAEQISAKDPAKALAHREAAERLARTGVEAKLGEPRLYLVLAEAEVVGTDEKSALETAVSLLESGVNQAESLRETAPPEKTLELLEAEIELRWYLANYRLEVAGLDPEKPQEVAEQTHTTIETLRLLGCRRELVDFLAVRLQLVEGEWDDAARTLETLRLRVMDMPGVRRRVDGMLAVAYGQLENPDQQIDVFRRALTDDPLWTAARVGLAGALVEAGRTEEALQNYATLMHVPGVPERLAQLLTVTELQKTESSRDVEKIQQVLEAAGTAAGDDPAVALLNVEFRISQGDFTGAERMLSDLAERHPDSPEVWQARVSFASLRQDQDHAPRLENTRQLVAAGGETFGDVVAVRVAQAELARLENGENFSETLKSLAEAPASYTETEQRDLLRSLALVARRAGDTDAERMMWTEIAKHQPNSLSAWLRVAEFAVDARDEPAVSEALTRIREIEGPSGPNGDFITAYDKIVQATNDPPLRDNPAKLAKFLAEPRELLQQAAEKRAYWANVPRAQGMLEALLGNQEQAVEFLQQAWQLGDRTPVVATALVEHYRSTDRLAQAEGIVAELQGSTASGNRELGQLGWRLRLEQGDINGAVEAAGQRAEQTQDFRDWITYANVLLVRYRLLPEQDRTAEAGKAVLDKTRQTLAGVVESHPQEPDAWLAQIAFLQRIGETEAAAAAVKQAETGLAELPQGERLIGLAQCRAVLGETEQAAALFEEAIAAEPDNINTRMMAADYMSRVGALEDAQAQVDWILDPAHEAPDAAVQWARRRAAFILAASRGRHEDVLRAIEMLRGDAEAGQVSVDDLRAQVALLAGRGTSKDHRMMLGILEEIERQTELTPVEKFQMVSLYESTDQWSFAKQLLDELHAADESNPRYLAAYIVGTARHEPATEETAEQLGPFLQELETVEPNSLRTALARAEFEKHFGSTEQAGAVLTSFVAEFESGASRGGESIDEAERAEIENAARAAEDLGAEESALALYQRLAEISDRPEDSLPLATYLARLSRYEEALNLLEKTSPTLSPDAIAVTAVNIVSLGVPGQDQVARAEALVDAALNKSPDSTRIQISVAGLRAVQGRYDEAENMYRAVLKQQPTNAAVLNNLAWLLMIAKKDMDEAAQLIDEAIAVAGPVADLVDTRGAIDLARGQEQEAMEDLQEAFAASPNASIGFHLAIALERLGREEEAKAMFQQVRDMGLDLNRLHPTEHAAFKELAQQFSET